MAPSHTQALKSQYPWTSTPLIASAPMRLISTAPLAVAVSEAGGLGFLGVGTDVSTFSSLLAEASSTLESSPIPNTPSDVLPTGVGFICWGAKLATAISVTRSARLKPAAAWLFAPQDTKDLVSWAEGLRKASNGRTRIWIQVGTVAMALEVAKSCRPDVLVIQGADAGGHGVGLTKSGCLMTS